MTSILIAAFVLGFSGSFHCVGMCGPIALTLPAINSRNKWTSSFFYLLGKTITYTLLGFSFGLLGRQLMMAGLQQILSITAGLLLLIVVGMMIIQAKQLHSNFLTNWISQKVIPLFNMARIRNNNLAAFNIGMVNGLLPCGLVYIGLIGSLATGDVAGGSLFMLAFGLGTMPVMLSFLLMARQFSLNFRSRIKKLAPAFVALVAVLLIVRGLGLGIPYLSPMSHNSINMQSSTAVECHP